MATSDFAHCGDSEYALQLKDEIFPGSTSDPLEQGLLDLLNWIMSQEEVRKLETVWRRELQRQLLEFFKQCLQERGPLGRTRRKRVKPQCNCCASSEVPLKKKNARVLSDKTMAPKTSKKKKNKKKSLSRDLVKGTQECRIVQSEATQVNNEEQKNEVVKKAKKKRKRDAKGVKGFTSRSSGSNSLEKEADSSGKILLECETIHALPSSLLQLPETPVEKAAKPQTHAAENTPNSNRTLSSPDSQQEDISVDPSTAAENVKEKASQSTDGCFLDLVKATNEQVKSTDTDSEHPDTHVGPYTVKHNLGAILQAIFDKYGDIAKDCPIQSSSARSNFLEGLCEVLDQLKDVDLASCQRHHLKSLLVAVTTAENLGLDVTWLRARYDDLKTALKGIKNYSTLKDDLVKTQDVADSRKKSLDSKEAEMMNLQSKMQIIYGQLGLLRAEREDLEGNMSVARKKAKRFCCRDLADGLL